MRQWCLRDIKIALTCTLGLLVLASCSNAERSFGGGVFSKGNVVTTVLDDAGIIVKNDGPEEYKQRPPLAIPISTDSLPEPESDENSDIEPPPVQDSEPAYVTTDTEISYNEEPSASKRSGADSSGREGIPRLKSSLLRGSTDGGDGNGSEPDGEELQESAIKQKKTECEKIPGKGNRSCPLIRPPEGYN